MGVRKAVGRILTNLVKPEGYDLAEHVRNVAKAGPKKVVKAIIKDEPIYGKTMSGRDRLWRASFDLPAHKSSRIKENNALKTFTDKKGKVIKHELNPNSKTMKEVAVDTALKHNIITNKKLNEVAATSPEYHSIMGGYSLNSKKKSTATYKDVWDFGVNKGEKFEEYVPEKTTKLRKKVTNVARNSLDKLISKQQISGELTAPSNFKPLSSTKKTKLTQVYKKHKAAGNTRKAEEVGSVLMNDELVKKKLMKITASEPRPVVVKNVTKGKFFGFNNPKKTIKDFRETSWEKRRAKNTSATKKIVDQVSKQKSIANKNLGILAAQGTATTVVGAPTADLIIS